MKIPKVVRVGGVDYDVELAHSLDKFGELHGLITLDENLIEIRRCGSKDFMVQTFMHELLHAIQYHIGAEFSDKELENERIIDAVAKSLYMVMQDNPGIFDSH